MTSEVRPINAALFKAVTHGELVAVETLLGFGADPNTVIKGLSVFDVAAQNQEMEIMEALLRAGAFDSIATAQMFSETRTST